MCATCGCGKGEVTIEGHEHGHPSWSRPSPMTTTTRMTTIILMTIHHDHEHDDDPESRVLAVERDLLGQKQRDSPKKTAPSLAARGILALNLVSSPGSGKTALLCKTIEAGQARSCPT